MSTKPAGTSLSTKIADMAALSHSNHPLFLDELEVDATGSIIAMVGRVWDVNATTGLYLSMDFVVSDQSAKATIAHNFLRLKGGGIFLIKNFVVRPNKDEFRVFRHDMFMLEFDGSTTIRKVFANGVDFVRYTFQLVDFDDIELTNNKYMTDVSGYVTNVGRTSHTKSGSKTLDFYLATQRVTLWGGVGDSFIEKKTAHVEMCTIMLTSMTAKTYNNKLYLSSTSSMVIYDNDDIPPLQELKSVTRYRLEVVIADDTTQIVVVMFNKIPTELLKCYVDILIEAEDEMAGYVADTQNYCQPTITEPVKMNHTPYATMNRDKQDKERITPSVSDLLKKSLRIHSNTAIRQDETIQSYYGPPITETDAVVYVIEFQKRGLPHTYVLLWLEEHSKCRTPREIDDIISAELPSPIDDPAG
nr:hypothetical protein [Tanacetum cinerariifolium]